MSLSARRAWIEIIDDLEPSSTRKVALRKESVDRNNSFRKKGQANNVALRKESVDRNHRGKSIGVPSRVALRKESVDRNMLMRRTQTAIDRRSPQGERG